MKKGYISLFLVLSITLGASVSLYHFFEQNEYFIYLKREEFLFESKRLLTMVCLHVVKERVYAGLTAKELQNIYVSKIVFKDEITCSVIDSDIKTEGTYLVYKVRLETPFGVKLVVYTLKPGEIERSIYTS